MITALIVWGAIPFVAITVYAGLTQVPRELVEAAAIDGASRWQRLPRRHAAAAEADLRDPDQPLDHLGLPGLQPDLAHAQRPPPHATTTLMAIYAFTHVVQASSEYGLGSAIAVVMVAILLVVSVRSTSGRW